MDSRYSRQELVFGKGSNRKLKELKITIYGDGDALQQEVYKNLCMMGIGRIILIIDSDISRQKFFKIDLNPDCKVTFKLFPIRIKIKTDSDCFIVCNLNFKSTVWDTISHICHLQNIWFIASSLKDLPHGGGSIFWSQPLKIIHGLQSQVKNIILSQ